MNSTVSLILKVLIPSVILAIAIKYGAPYLAIAPTAAHALLLVTSPTLIMAAVLFWRSRHTQPQS